METATLHQLALAGDLAGVQQFFSMHDREDCVNAYDAEGWTPLMRAVQSDAASVDVVRELIRHGADVNARDRVPYLQPNPVLSHALRRGDLRKVELLLDHGADIHYEGNVSCSGGDALADAAWVPRHVCPIPLFKLVIERAEQSGKSITAYGGRALCILARDRRFAAVQFLLDAGAPAEKLAWTPLIRAVALGSLEDVRRELAAGAVLEAQDCWDRTAFVLAVHMSDLEKAMLVADAGADVRACSRFGTAVHCAVGVQNMEMLRWLLSLGIPADQPDKDGGTALTDAIGWGNLEAVAALVEAGADVNHEGGIATPLWHANSTAIAAYLLAAGADPANLPFEARRGLVGLEPEPNEALLCISPEQFRDGQRRVFGRSNPERHHIPFWDAMIRSGLDAYRAARRCDPDATATRRPVWCAQRHGQSITFLDDGRIVQIGGEHEDGYDPDFCIYNDVFVHHPDGSIDVLGYPEMVFPPTDFHTATVAGDRIYIIGRLGYEQTRRPGKTPVYRLDLSGFGMQMLEPTGDCPGWIWKHRAVLSGPNEIRISRGNVMRDDGTSEKNGDVYVLDIERLHWRRE